MVSKLPDESDRDFAAFQAYAACPMPRPLLNDTPLAELAFRFRWDERLTAAAALATLPATPREQFQQMQSDLLALATVEMRKLFDRVLARPQDSVLSPRDAIALFEVFMNHVAGLQGAAPNATANLSRLTPEARARARQLQAELKAELRKVEDE